MFLHKAYFLPDFATHNSLPELYLRIRSVEVKFEGDDRLYYFPVDERRVFEVRDRVRMGTTVQCVVDIPTGEAQMAWYVSAGWRRGKFQLWVHGIAGGCSSNNEPRLEQYNIFEYSLYTMPTDGRDRPSPMDRPLDNYATLDEVVINPETRTGREIVERLKAESTKAPVAAVDIHQIANDEPVTVAILKAGSEMLGCLTFRENADINAICHDLCQLVPAQHWLGCEAEMYQIADHLVSYRQMPASIPRIFKTKRFSCDSAHCTLDRQLLSVENGQPVFKLFTEQRNALKSL